MSDPLNTGFKPGELHIDPPVWVLFDSREVDALGKPNIKGLIRHAGGEPRFIPVFTDWDLALRYINDCKPVACALPFGKAQLEKLLSHLEQAGGELVGFDFDRRSQRARTARVSEVLACVRGDNQ